MRVDCSDLYHDKIFSHCNSTLSQCATLHKWTVQPRGVWAGYLSVAFTCNPPPTPSPPFPPPPTWHALASWNWYFCCCLPAPESAQRNDICTLHLNLAYVVAELLEMHRLLCLYMTLSNCLLLFFFHKVTSRTVKLETYLGARKPE